MLLLDYFAITYGKLIMSELISLCPQLASRESFSPEAGILSRCCDGKGNSRYWTTIGCLAEDFFFEFSDGLLCYWVFISVFNASDV
jgi:hypothetical protein